MERMTVTRSAMGLQDLSLEAGQQRKIFGAIYGMFRHITCWSGALEYSQVCVILGTSQKEARYSWLVYRYTII